VALLLSDRHHSVGHVPEFCRFPDSPITFVDYKGNGHLKVQGCLYPSALAASREMPQWGEQCLKISVLSAALLGITTYKG